MGLIRTLQLCPEPSNHCQPGPFQTRAPAWPASPLLSLHSNGQQCWAALTHSWYRWGWSLAGSQPRGKGHTAKVHWTGSLISPSMRTPCACCLFRRTRHIAAHIRPGAAPRQLSRRHQTGRMNPPERRGRHAGDALTSAEMFSAVPDSCTHCRAQHPTKCCWRGRPTAPPHQPLSLFGPRVGGSLQELGRTVGAGKHGCSRHSPALWVGAGQGGPPQAPAAPRGAAQLPPAVWKHVPCPALTLF